MSLRALRHFVVVAEELHMHRAAERLHIAQPALSQQIKQLEQRLGVVLFSRANRRLTLTAAGEAFWQKTRLALEMVDQAALDAQRTARGEQGRLHLGYVSSAMYDSKLPGLLRELRVGDRVVNRLADGLVDFGACGTVVAVKGVHCDVAFDRAQYGGCDLSQHCPDYHGATRHRSALVPFPVVPSTPAAFAPSGPKGKGIYKNGGRNH